MSKNATGANSYVAVIKQDPTKPREIPVNPVMQMINFDADTMSLELETGVSNHVRSDRMTPDLNIKGFTIGGGYSFEFQFENSLADELLQAFLWAKNWTTPWVEVDVAGAVITAAGVWDMSGVVSPPEITSGQGFKLSGTGNSGENDGFYYLTEVSADTFQMEPPPKADETLVTGAVLTGSMIRNDSVYQPFFIERGHLDVTQYFKFVGMSANVMTLSFPDQDDVTGSYDFVGLFRKLEQAIETGATYTQPTNNPVFSTSTNMPLAMMDGIPLESCFIKELDMEINNNVTPKTGIGVYGACATNAHRLSITGKISLYFENENTQERFENGTPLSISWVVEDSSGHGYMFRLPRIKYDTAKANVTSVDDDVMDDASYVATADPETLCMIQIDKF